MIAEYLSDFAVKVYLWMWIVTLAGWCAFGHLGIKKRGLPCYMVYLSLILFSIWLMSNIMLYARWLRLFDPAGMDAFAFTPLWYVRWVPICITTTIASIHVIYKNYFWDGFKQEERRGGVK